MSLVLSVLRSQFHSILLRTSGRPARLGRAQKQFPPNRFAAAASRSR